MIARATAINLAGRRIGSLFNFGPSDPGEPVISLTMTERKRQEIAKLIENEQHLPTCQETFWYPVDGPAWSHADHIHIMHVRNGRITGRRNRGRKRKAA